MELNMNNMVTVSGLFLQMQEPFEVLFDNLFMFISTEINLNYPGFLKL